MLHWLHFRNRQALQGRLLKTSKNAAGVGARDIFAFVSRHVFLRKIAQMLHWLVFRDRQASERPLVKSSKNAAGVGARDIFGFVSHIAFCRKIAQMLHWLEFRDMHGLFSTVPFFDHAVRGMQIT